MTAGAKASRPFRPPLAFRVGVTGVRDLVSEAAAAVDALVADVLDEICRICADVAETAAARAVYASSGPDSTTAAVDIRLTVLSPLARGSDQLVARAALARGFELSVPTPFPLAIYEEDFADDPKSFRDLLAQAEGRVLEIDGDRGGDDAWRSYEAVGRLVARNCDLLIAIWDDETPPKGRGGTRDTVWFALRNGVPIWWIDPANKRRPALVTHVDELTRPRPEGASFALGEFVKAHLMPPSPPLAKASGIVQGLWLTVTGLAVAIGRELHVPEDPLQMFLADTEPTPSQLWTIHRRVIGALARGLTPYEDAGVRAVGYWWTAYEAPDRFSGAYAMRYRSAYVYMILLAAAALFSSSLASLFDASHRTVLVDAMGLAEFGLLATILIVIVAAKRGHWHDRWITYRLLAELCRKQSALGLLGWSLPIVEAKVAANSEAQESAWVNWYYGAVGRAAPLTVGSLSGEALARIRAEISAVLVSDQIGYHRHRAAECKLIASNLLKMGEWCFFITLLVVLIKVVIYFTYGSPIVSSFLSTVLPTIAASIFALRSYAELDLLANQSSRMAGQLEVVRERLDVVALTGPLASQALGHDLSRVTAVMLSDVAGWAQLFRMKGIEAG